MKKILSRILSLSLPLTLLGITSLTTYKYHKNYDIYESKNSFSYKENFKKEMELFNDKVQGKILARTPTDNIVTLEVLVDDEVKSFYDDFYNPLDGEEWQDKLLKNLTQASERFNKEFGITFKIGKVDYWDSTEDLYISQLMEVLEKKTFRGLNSKEDIVLAFTGQRDRTPYGGITNYLGKLSLLRTYEETIFNEFDHLIQHELSHLFGAMDTSNGRDSVMDYRSNSTKWDRYDKMLMLPNKDRFKNKP